MIEPIESSRYIIDEKRLDTINKLLDLCVEFSLDINFRMMENWLITLRTLNREISFFYSSDEKKEVKEIFKSINEIRNKESREPKDKTDYFKFIEKLDTYLKSVLHNHKYYLGE